MDLEAPEKFVKAIEIKPTITGKSKADFQVCFS